MPSRALSTISGPRRASASARGRGWRVIAAVVAVALVGAPIVVLGEIAPVSAATIRPFEPVYSVNTNGSIVMAANTLMTCVSGASCTTARNATSGNFSNNGYTSQFVDVDSDGTTFNSSSATLDVPTDGGVLFAALVWGGRTGTTGSSPSDPDLRENVKLSVAPASGGTSTYPLTASQVDVSGGTAYQGYLDVTDIVAAAGDGVYTVANVQSSVGSTNQYAGWSLIVAVSDPLAPARNLTIFTGFGSIGSNDPPESYTVSGFLTPPSGPVLTTLGAVTYEGDMGIVGDTFSLNGTAISDPLNPADNPFNSTISNRGSQGFGAPPTSSPAYNNQLGFDADLISADGILANGATSATLSISTAGDQYFPGALTFATELYDPMLLGNKTVSDLNGGNIVAGDTLRYTVPVENIGLDTAVKSRFFDAIPTGTSFVPGSITLNGVTQSDASDTDNARFITTPTGHVEAFIGTGATSTSGGSIPVTQGSAQHTVTFDVTVNSDVTDGQELVNAASLNYRGQTTDAAQASATNAVVSPVTATPTPGNDPPTATPAVVSFTPLTGTPGAIIPVLDGDTDPENDPLDVVAVTDASGGTVAINADGTVTYTPRPDFAGRDVFTYTIEDAAGNRSTATVRIDVINTAPVAVDDSATVPAGVTTSVVVLPNDTDANGDTVAVRSVSPSSTQGGTVAVVGGVVRYTPAAGFRGTDTFTYVVEDTRGGFDTGLVTVSVVNTAPVAVADSYSTTSGSTTSGSGVAVSVLANDTDLNGDTLTATRLTAPSNGTITLASDGTGTYLPNAGFRGTDSFTYRVSDGFGGTATTTVTIVVNGVPDAVADIATTPEATPVNVTVLTNDTDPDDDALTVSITGAPANGIATVESGGVIRYTPDDGYAGTDVVTYQISDGRGGTDSATVTITVENALPVAGPDTATTATDTLSDEIDVLANDTDVNVTAGVAGQALVISGTPTADNGATVVVNPNGTLSIQPATGFSGVVTVSYTLSDGAGGTDVGTVSLTVSNGAPTAVPDAASTPTATAATIDVLDNDIDPNTADTLSIVAGSLGTPVDATGTTQGSVAIVGGEVVYTPPTGFAGDVTFVYQMTDGTTTSSATVTVTVENALPVGVADSASTPTNSPTGQIDVVANDTDPNVTYGTPGQELVVSGTPTADNGATVVLNPNGTVTVTPAPGFSGVVTVTYTVSDGAGGSASGILTLAVSNSAPTATPDTASTQANTPTVVDVLANDVDANTSDTLTIVPGSLSNPVDSSGTPRGTVTIVDGQVQYTPPAGFSGVITFSYQVTDGAVTTTGTVTLTVNNVAPTPSPDSVTAQGSGPTTIDVLGNDTDPDGGVLTIVSVTQPTHGRVIIVDNKLVYTPDDSGFAGTVTFTYTVSDGQGGLITETVTLEVRSASLLGATGADAIGWALLALLLIALGSGTMVVAGRRHRSA